MISGTRLKPGVEIITNSGPTEPSATRPRKSKQLTPRLKRGVPAKTSKRVKMDLLYSKSC
jgi:hypothetical protein